MSTVEHRRLNLYWASRGLGGFEGIASTTSCHIPQLRGEGTRCVGGGVLVRESESVSEDLYTEGCSIFPKSSDDTIKNLTKKRSQKR